LKREGREGIGAELGSLNIAGTLRREIRGRQGRGLRNEGDRQKVWKVGVGQETVRRKKKLKTSLLGEESGGAILKGDQADTLVKEKRENKLSYTERILPE